MNKAMLKKYARLMIQTGVNLQKGQTLIIRAQTEVYPFVEILADAAYRAGAGDVQIEWSNQRLTRLEYRYRTMRAMSKVPAWQEAKWDHEAKTLPALIRLCSEDPDGLKGIDSEKMKKVRQKRFPIQKPYRDRMENRHQWLVAAVPSRAWAEKVFPNERTNAAVEHLWKSIMEACLVTRDNDPIEVWKQKNAEMAELCKKLTAYRFDYLEYKNSLGTDFRCSLTPKSLWCAGGETTLNGVYFNPNLPTEEVFTTPAKGKCEGRLVSSMPLSYQGSLIENFYIDYKDGKAVAWDAEKGKDVLDSILHSDEGSLMLGELALVPIGSPIQKQGLLYYETLFDENASCHVAIGSGYSNCIEGFEHMTKEELDDIGVNDSLVHVDFMIGTDDLSVVGRKDGVPTKIFENGTWAI